MSECFRCGVSGENVRLYDAISNKGIVKICEDCSVIERIPVIRKPTEEQLNSVHKSVSVRDRLTNMNRGKLMAGKEVSLRQLVDRNFKVKGISHPDLIENFHWTIQRIKRARKITREQFAKAIGESEATVRMVEQGFLPENDYRIISKIESYLGVSLRKAGSSGFPETNQESIKELPKRFTPEETRQIKISDLKEMKKRQDEGKSKSEEVSWDEEGSEDDEKYLDEHEEISEEED